MDRCQKNLQTFDKLLKESGKIGADVPSSSAQSQSDSAMVPPGANAASSTMTADTTSARPETKLVVMCCIQDAVQWAACAKDSQLGSPSLEDPNPPEASRTAKHIQVLVTGSLHLVGGVLKILDPDLVLMK